VTEIHFDALPVVFTHVVNSRFIDSYLILIFKSAQKVAEFPADKGIDFLAGNPLGDRPRSIGVVVDVG
jgi:hypothetical protein